MNERDSHFQNAAKLLWDDLLHLNGHDYIDVTADSLDSDRNERYHERITQFLSDFANHVAEEVYLDVSNNCTDMYHHMSLESVFADVPDLKEWPKPEQ